MTLSTQTITLGIDDAKIFELNTDDDEHGLTYYPAVSVPAMQKIEIAQSVTETALKRDEKILDYYVKLDCNNWAFSNTKISLEALTILEGGTVTTTETSHTYSITSSSVPKYFKLEAKANYTAGEVGDYHLRLYKCKANNIDVQYMASDYAVVSATGVAIETKHDGSIKDYIINETATAIS